VSGSENQLLEIENNILRITQKGFMNYGAVFSLFFMICEES